MIRKILCLFAIANGLAAVCLAQTTDVASQPKDKKYEHTVGVQLNGLINQVLNFSNTTPTAVSNPYLVTYNINNKKTGWGLRLGLGYTYNSSSTNDGINVRTSDINDLHLRLGVERKYKLSDNFNAGVGVDFLFNANNDNTVAKTISFDTITTTTATIVSSYGGEAMAWLNYNITKNITIGTEASLFFLTGSNKITVTVKQSPGGGVQQKPTVTDNNLKQSNANMPLVFYLAVRF